MSELLPCPFCGDSSICYEDEGLTAPFFVECMRCLTRTWYFHTKEAALSVWNTRHCPERDLLLRVCEWNDEHSKLIAFDDSREVLTIGPLQDIPDLMEWYEANRDKGER